MSNENLDSLTKRVTEQLRVKTSRGAVSPTGPPVTTPSSPTGKISNLDNSLWENIVKTRGTPSWYTATEGYRQPTDNTGINALGAGAWSFIDQASFGVADWLLPQVGEDIDWDDPAAKWASAIGGFGGFVLGAPMKIVGKGVQKGLMLAAKPFLKKAGKRSADEVINAARRIGKEGGLTRKSTKDILGKYRTLVAKAQTDPLLKGGKFRDEAQKLIDNYVANGILKKEITEAEAEIFKKMFQVGGKTYELKAFGKTIIGGAQTSNLLTRPIQDITGILFNRGLGVTNPILARFIGHATRDIAMFPVIDGLFEGVASHKDGRDFDWSRPMWGGINGLAFAQLSWLKPAGKTKTFKTDFLSGIKAAFGKNIYKNKTPEQVKTYAKFWGRQLLRTPKEGGTGRMSSVVKIEYGGKTGSVDLLDDALHLQLKSVWGDSGNKALQSYLKKHLKEQGRAMIKHVHAEGWRDLKATWLRMAAGGALFNTHTFYEMFMHDAEATVDDILPHFLIGAWMQRGSNPARFDMKAGEINQVRRNMYTLGVDPTTLSKIPTFDGLRPRHLSLFNDSKYDKIKQAAIDEGIISNSPEVTNEMLPGDVKSVEMSVEDPAFTLIYDSLVAHKRHIKHKGDISKKSADKLVKIAKQIDPMFKNSKELDRLMQESISRSMEGFERGFIDIIDHVRLSDDMDILKISTGEIDGRQVLTVPKTIIAEQSLINKARNLELDWIVDAEGKKIKDPDTAEAQLLSKIAGFNKIIQTTQLIESTNALPVGNEVKIVGPDKYGESGENLIRTIYEKVSQSEKSVNGRYPLKSLNAEGFTYLGEVQDYQSILMHHHSVKFADKAVEIFGEDFQQRDKLIPLLQRAGIFTDPAITGEAKLVPDINKIKIETPEGLPKDEAENQTSEARRFLSRILTLQRIEGSRMYKQASLDEANKVKTNLNDINNLKKKLASYGYDFNKIPEYIHEQLTYHAARNLVKGSELSMEQTEALFNLKEFGLAEFGAGERGRGVGFIVKLIDMNAVPVGLGGAAKEYNSLIKRAVKDSNGLAVIDSKLLITEPDLIKLANEVTEPLIKDQSYSARAKLLEFLNILEHEVDKDYGQFQRQVDSFIKADPTNIARLQKWLIGAGVLKVGEGHKKDAQIDITKLAEKAGVELVDEHSFARGDTIEKMLIDRMNIYGVDPAYAERQFKMRDQNARGKMIEDSNDSSFEDNIRIGDFYKTYRIDGKDLSKADIKEQSKDFDDLIYQDKENKIIQWGLINKIIDTNIHVKSGNTYKKFSNLPPAEQDARRPEVMSHVLGLAGQRKAQAFVDVYKWVNGGLKKEKQSVQIGRFYKLMNTIGIPYEMVDTRVSVYESTPDGRYHNRIFVDFMGDTSNLSLKNRKRIQNVKNHITNSLVNTSRMEHPQGIHVMRPMPNMEAIALEPKHFEKVREAFEKFNEEYGKHEIVSKDVKDTINDLEVSLRAESRTPAEVSVALTLMTSREMLLGKDSDRLFIDFLNGDVDAQKLLERTRLFNTKNFIMGDAGWAAQVADAYKAIGDKDVSDLIRKFLKTRKLGDEPEFKYVEWNDELGGNLQEEVNNYIKDKGIKGWEWKNVIGDAHKDVTSFDSSTYVSKELMTYLHAIIGHNPNSRNPIKPVISSGGADATLILGKTLFVYDPGLDGFFKNAKVDMLVAKSAIKARNQVGEIEGRDPTMLNVSWAEIEGMESVNSSKIKTMPLNAVGLKAEKDYDYNSAKESQADYNYMNNTESQKVYATISERLGKNLDAFVEIARDPMQMRAFILKESGDKDLWTELADSEGTQHLSNMVVWSNLTRDANPMSYSDSIVKNKMYSMFVDEIINNRRSVTNQSEKSHSARYGGSTYLIQSPTAEYRARPTLVDENGVKIQHGEVILAHHEREINLDELFKDNKEIRFINNSEVLTPEKALGEYWELFSKGNDNKDVQTLGHLKDYLDVLKNPVLARIDGKVFEQKGVIDPNLQIAIAVRRNPRTRPNDLALLGLKDFFTEKHGNVMSINSLDVANVFEGDYDADKSDYWFAHNKNFYEHVQRTQDFYVQGVDPSGWIPKGSFHWAQSPAELASSIEKMAADIDLYKSSIGRVQKIARKLGYAQKLGVGVGEGNYWYDGFNGNNLEKISNKSRLLFGGNKGDDFAIVLDYDHTNYYHRAALETQYIIDGKRAINLNIARDVDAWTPEFLFPEIDKSITGMDLTNKRYGTDFVNDMRRDGSSGGKRVRIFRKIIERDGKLVEEDLSILDRTLINELLGEYGRFLNVTGDSMFGKTGESKKVGYEQVHDATENFRLFNKNLNKNLYHRLRGRYVRNEKDLGKWYQDIDFKKYFGAEEVSYKDRFGKDKKIYVHTKNIMNDKARDHGMEFFNGDRGAPVDRILAQLSIVDPFERGSSAIVGADMNKLMNDWYGELLNGSNVEESGDAIGRITDKVRGASKDINWKINTITSMKKKIWQIKQNNKVPYKVQRASVDKISKIISDIEAEVSPMIPKKYWATRTGEDLINMTYVNVSKQNVLDGAIHYSTMNTIRDLLPFGTGKEDFGLNPSGVKALNEIKAMRKLFYGNQTSLKDVLNYGDKTLLSSEMRKYLENLPDISTVYEIETGLLQKAYNAHGPAFIYAFMQPAQNKYAVGVFDGKPVSVPFQATNIYNPSSRYRRGIKFLTGVASKQTEINWGADLTTDLLRSIQQVEAQWHRFFNRETSLKDLLSQGIGAETDIGEGMRINMGDMKLPSFNKDFQKSFPRFGDIQWTRNAGRVHHGRNLMNDWLLSFYKDILHIAGKDKDFNSYLHQMNDLQALMIEGKSIDPFKYLSIRGQMQKEVREIAQTVFSGGLDKSNKYVRNMMKNPVYAIMGGPEYFRGYAFEKQSILNPERLRTIKKLSRTIEEIRDDMELGSDRFRRRFEEIKVKCKE